MEQFFSSARIHVFVVCVCLFAFLAIFYVIHFFSDLIGLMAERQIAGTRRLSTQMLTHRNGYHLNWAEKIFKFSEDEHTRQRRMKKKWKFAYQNNKRKRCTLPYHAALLCGRTAIFLFISGSLLLFLIYRHSQNLVLFAGISLSLFIW